MCQSLLKDQAHHMQARDNNGVADEETSKLISRTVGSEVEPFPLTVT
jgi:hypothetical protein